MDITISKFLKRITQNVLKMLLAQSGWVDSDGDGYVDKDGKKLRLNSFITYTARPEVILYAEALQVDYKKLVLM